MKNVFLIVQFTIKKKNTFPTLEVSTLSDQLLLGFDKFYPKLFDRDVVMR